MSEQNEATEPTYPLGRGYGHDYMRGGEVLGGYGYSERDDYERRRGERAGDYQGEERRARPEGAAGDEGDTADLS